MIRPMTVKIISEPNAILLAVLPKSAKIKVMLPYKSGPTIDETLPEKANNPKNWPRFSSGVISTI